MTQTGLTYRLSTASAPLRRIKRPGWKAVYEKEVLRTGTWKPRGQAWTVTPETLRTIARTFNVMRQRGVSSYLVWDHNHSARAEAGRVLGLRADGNRLLCAIGTNDPDTIRKLDQDPDTEVSVEVIEKFTDGLGRVYPLALTHVAIVQHPVVPGQKPFRRVLSLHLSESTQMAKEETPVATPEPVVDPATVEPAPGDSSAPISWFVKLLNKEFSDVIRGPIPASVDTVKELRIAIETRNSTAKPKSDDGYLDEMTASDIPGGSASVDMSLVEQLKTQIAEKDKALAEKERDLALERSKSVTQAKSAFVLSLDRLCAEGRVQAANRDGLLAAGEASGFQLSLLKPFEELQTVPTKPKAGTGASPDPAVVTDNIKKATRDRAANCFGIDADEPAAA